MHGQELHNGLGSSPLVPMGKPHTFDLVDEEFMLQLRYRIWKGDVMQRRILCTTLPETIPMHRVQSLRLRVVKPRFIVLRFHGHRLAVSENANAMPYSYRGILAE